jgi:hypothetical protein
MSEDYRAGVINLLLLTYPQIKIVPLCVPPNKSCLLFMYPQIKNCAQMSFFWVIFFFFCAPPVSFSRTPRGKSTSDWDTLLGSF